MHIRLASDLHLNHYTSTRQRKILEGICSTATPYDVLCVAGDVSEGKALIGHLRRIIEASAAPVVYVPGNHDYSEVGIQTQKERLMDLCLDLGPDKFWPLLRDESMYGIDGRTWWYEWTQDTRDVARNWGWYDYRWIPNFLETWEKENQAERSFDPRPGKVIMSHMLPSRELVHPVYRQDASNIFFVQSRGEEIMQRCKPRAWLFGHTHKWTDQVVHGVRCIARPYGYPRESEKINLKTYHEKATFDL